MAVIAVLVAVAVPTFGSQLEKSRQSADIANLRDVYSVVKLALLNQDEPNPDADERDGAKYLNTLKKSATTTTETNGVDVYVDPDTGYFYGEETGESYMPSTLYVGKATAAKVIDSEYPTGIVYYGNAKDKRIQAHFNYSSRTRTFGLDWIKFEGESASSSNAVEVVMISGAEAPESPVEVAYTTATYGGVKNGTAGTATVNFTDLFKFVGNGTDVTDLKLHGSASDVTVKKADDGTSVANAIEIAENTKVIKFLDGLDEGTYSVTFDAEGKVGNDSFITKVEVNVNVPSTSSKELSIPTTSETLSLVSATADKDSVAEGEALPNVTVKFKTSTNSVDFTAPLNERYTLVYASTAPTNGTDSGYTVFPGSKVPVLEKGTSAVTHKLYVKVGSGSSVKFMVVKNSSDADLSWTVEASGG